MLDQCRRGWANIELTTCLFVCDIYSESLTLLASARNLTQWIFNFEGVLTVVRYRLPNIN